MTNDAHAITEQINAMLAGFGLNIDDVSYCNSYLTPRPNHNRRGFTYEADYTMFFQKNWTSDRIVIRINGIELRSGDKGSALTSCAQSLRVTWQRICDYDADLKKYMTSSEELTIVNGTETLKGIPRAQAASVIKWARAVEDTFNTKFPR